MDNPLNEQLLEILEDRKAEDIDVIDIRDRSSLCDTFIIASGTSAIHVRSIAENLKARMEEAGVELLHEEGTDTARWILLDYGATIVHLFHPEERAFYSLDKLWSRSR